MVMVDYLQLAHGDTPTSRKDLEIAQISHGLKALAKELNIPVRKFVNDYRDYKNDYRNNGSNHWFDVF